MRRLILLEAVAIALTIMVAAELGRYFKDPVAPDEQHLSEPPNRYGLDPTRAPAEMFADCRASGKLLHATKTDGPDWIYDCL